MSIWVEIRCDVRSDKSFWKNNELERCWNDDNATPMNMADNTQKSVNSLIKSLNKIAIKAGWVKINSEWQCPFCRKIT